MQADVRASVVDSLDDAVVVIDGSRVVVAWNAAMERLTSCARTDALACPIEEVLASLPPAAWRAPIDAALAGARGSGPALPVEAAGTRVWLEPRWAPLADGPGAILVLRDVTEAQKQALFMRALETVGRSLTSSLELEQVLDTIAEKTREVMSADSAMVASWDGEAEKLTVLRASGRLTADYAPGGIPVAGGPVSVAAREGRAVATSDVLADPRWELDSVRRRHIAREGFKAVAAVPLTVKGVVHGALAVHQWTARTFTEDEMALLMMLAEQAALALANARLYAEARRRGDRLRELAQLEQMVAASLDPDAVLQAIAAAAARLVGADIVQVWAADDITRQLELRASSGADELPAAPATIPFGEGITGRTAVQKTAIYVADMSREPGALSGEWARQSGIQRLLAVPMLSGDMLLGVVTVRSRSDSLASEEDRALITTLAAQAAVAVQNAAAYAGAVARAARLRALAAVTRSITASLDTADVIRRIVAAASSMRAGALAAVHVVDADGGAMQVTASPEMTTLPVERPVNVGLPGLVAERRRAVLVAEPLKHPQTMSPEWWRERPRASYYGVPIMVGDTLVGVLDYIVPDGVPDPEEQDGLNLLAAHAGVAINNAALYQAEHVQSTRIRALAGINQRISSTLDLDELLRKITESAPQLVGVRFASFWLADEKARTLTPTAHSDPELAESFRVRVAPYEHGSVGWIARHHEPLVIEDVFGDDRMLDHDWWRRSGLRSFAGFPVMADDELLATLALCHTQPVRLTPSQRDVVDMFLAQAAVAIRNARLYREAGRRRDVAEALARLGRGLSSTLDIARIAELVASATVELLGARGAAVYRYDPEDGTLRTVVSQGPDGPGRTLVLQRGEGIAGRALSEGRIVMSADVLTDPTVTLSAALREEIERLGHRAAIGVPLLGTHGAIGSFVVRAENGREFSAEEVQALQSFADQGALAFENARLYAASQREQREAAALADTARILALSLDLDEVGDRIAQAVVPVFGAHSSSFYRIGADGELVAVARGGAGRGTFDTRLVWPKGVGIAARCVEDCRPIWTRDLLADGYPMPPALHDAVVALGTRAVLAAPLNVKGQVVGALVVAYAEPRDVEPREVALLQAFADQAALALENAQLYASARDSLARLRDTQAQLVQAAKLGALGQLVSGVAHELNNPLSVIIGYGQLLLSRDLPNPLRRPIELMVSQGDRMAKIVRNLLYFARQRPPERTLVDLEEMLEQTLALRLNQLALSSISVRREYAPSLPSIAADSHQLQQVILNLLLNAEQAILSTNGSGEIIVRTAPGPTPDTVVVQVADDGPGISPEDLGRVFEPFYTTKEVGQGTGLGLSVSYGIVQEHGGRLTAESRPGATTFTVELPVRSAAARVPVLQPTAQMLAGGRQALVVEDEPAVLDLVVTLLTDTGWQVDVAAGGRIAMDRVAARRYDLIVSDVRMPEGGGDEFYRKAVAQDPELGRRFLFITGDTANPSAWRFLKDAQVPVLEKPFAASAFLTAVRAIASLTASSPRA